MRKIFLLILLFLPTAIFGQSVFSKDNYNTGVIGNNGSNGSTIGGSSIPFKSTALFYLDGSILNSAGTYYFIDKSGNNRNFLITGYDFESNWTIGFPYKSAATISAPAADATLIAADINNFLYAGDGTPNQISVVSFFQNIDYANKFFSKHEAQKLDANSVETYEPRVKEIVLYSAVKTGSDLVNCNSYYNVPTKLSSGIKEVGAGKTYTTIQAAITAASANDVIYVYSGIYKETTYLTVNKAVEIICVGAVTIQSTGTASVIYFNRANCKLKNAVIDAESNTTDGFTVNNDLVVSWNVELNRCTFKNILTKLYTSGYGYNLNIHYCVFARETASTIAQYEGYINSSYFKNTSIDIGSANEGYIYTSGVKNSRIIGSLAGANNPIKLNMGVFNVIGNKITSNSGAITQASRTITTARDVVISYNRITMTNNSTNTTIRAIDLNVTANKYILNIHHNAIKLTEAINVGNSVTPISITNHQASIESNIIYIAHANHTVMSIAFSANDIAKVYRINNNYIYTESQANLAISLGGELGYTNCCSGSEIIGNYIEGITPATSGLHGIISNCGVNNIIKYNKIVGCGYGIVVKTGLQGTYTSGGVFYNLVNNCAQGVRIRGVIGLKVYGNTVLYNLTGGIYLDENSVQAGTQNCQNIEVKNNIIKGSGASGSLVYLDAFAADNGCIAQNNQLYGGQYLLTTGSTNYSDLATAQAAEKLTGCLVGNPNLNTSLIPATPIVIGENLGTSYADGLDISTNYGNSNQVPVIITKTQPSTGLWKVGAYIQN